MAVIFVAGCALSHERAVDAAVADVPVDSPVTSCDLEGVWRVTYVDGCGLDHQVEGSPFPMTLTSECRDMGCDAETCQLQAAELPDCVWHEHAEWPCASEGRNSWSDVTYRVVDRNRLDGDVMVSIDGNMRRCMVRVERVE